MSEADLVRDISAVMAKVQEGLEVVVERDYRIVAVIKPAHRPGRKSNECIALAKAFEAKLGYAPIADDQFATDLQAVIEGHRQPFETPWE